jgi:hypothetical protein
VCSSAIKSSPLAESSLFSLESAPACQAKS